MSSPLSPGTILLLLALLGVFVPVLQGLRAPPGKLVAPTDQYSKSFKATTDDNHPHRRKDAAGIPSHHRNGGFYSQSGSSRHDAFRHNNAITDENLQDTLLKSKTTRDSNRRHHINAIDSTHMGVRSYRKKYPTPKPRRHFYDNHEIGNSISRNPEKYYYSKDLRKHRNRHRPVELHRGHEEENYSHKKTHSFTKPVYPTEEYVPEEAHHQEVEVEEEEVGEIDWGLSNLSEQFDDNDFSDLSNSSFSNDSSVSNSSDSEKSKYSKCPTCQMRDGDRRYRIERLKQTILSKLHMTSPPNASQVTIPKMPAMEKYYGLDDKMMSDSPYTKRNNNDDDFAVRTERVFTKAREPPAKELLNITDSVYFAPPISLYTSKIKTAYLWFYIRKREIRQPSIHVTIQRILPESVPEKRLVTKIIFSTNLEAHRAHGWKRIDLRDTLRRWVTHPMSNHGLRIRALDDEGNNLIVLTPAPEVDRGYEPWLDTKVIEPTSHSRHRRSQALRCSDTSPESRCCRYPLYITFAEFGWEWIIAPSRAEADYCSGECHMTMQNVSPIGWIHQQVEMTGVSGSCCSPSKLGSLPLLYFDENYNVVFQVLQGMRVEECGCT